MTETYTVRVSKDYLVFCSAHFISYEGHRCERLHGHNYRAAVELDGDLDANWYVFDFIALKRMARAITDRLDHRVLLATANPLIRVRESQARVEVAFGERQWIFPVDDCVLLPIENTTAELLARYIGRQLRDEIAQLGPAAKGGLRAMRVEVEEGPGQYAVCQLAPLF